jgi:hypothetical protein
VGQVHGVEVGEEFKKEGGEMNFFLTATEWGLWFFASVLSCAAIGFVALFAYSWFRERRFQKDRKAKQEEA